jgi:acylglycerol lipase
MAMNKAQGNPVAVRTGRVLGPRGIELFWREWTNGSERPTATMLFTHGLGEHCGRYDALGTYFATRGLPVLGFDLRGHGQSDGQRGHADRFEDYVTDLMFLRGVLGERYPEAKIILLGHSMGGLIALNAAQVYGQAFSCIVASAPFLGVAFKVPAAKAAVGKMLSGIAPRLSMTNEIDPTLLSRNQEVGREYVADPNVGNQVTTRWFVTTMRAIEETKSRADKIQIPVYILHGTADGLVPEAESREFAARLVAPIKDYVPMEGFYHELFQEDGREQVFDLIWAWLGRTGVRDGV